MEKIAQQPETVNLRKLQNMGAMVYISGMEKEKTYRIGEMAALAGVTPRTVRYYEDLGLLKTHGCSAGGQRVYTRLDLV